MEENKPIDEMTEIASAALSCIGDGIILTDLTGRIVYINPKALEIIKKCENEVLGLNFDSVFALFDINSKKFISNPIKSVIDAGFAIKIDDCSAFYFGLNSVFISVTLSLLKSKENKTLGVLVSFRDTSNEKLLKQNDEVGLSPAFNENKKEFVNKSKIISKNLLDQIPTMVWMLDTELKGIYANKYWAEFTGMQLKDAQGFGYSETIYIRDLIRCRKALISAAKERKTFQTEIRLRHFDGNYRWCFISVVPYYTNDKKFIGYIGTSFDVTERKKATESLNRYQLLSDNSSEIILFIDMDGRIIEANKAAVNAYGYSYKELRSINFKDIRPDWGYSKEQVKNTVNKGLLFETTHKRKNGSMFEVEVSTQITSMDGKSIYLNIIRDITERKLANEILREQEEFFRTIFEQSPMGIAFGNDSEQIIEINPMFEKIVGRSKEELYNIKWADITHPDDLEKDSALFSKFKSGEINGYSMKKRYVKPDGTNVWVNLILAPFKIGSNVNHLCMVEDITDRIEAEEELQESERSKAVLLSNLPGMAYRCKFDRNWTMLFVSDGCSELTGYMPESLLNNKELSFNNLINLDYQEKLWEKWQQVIKDKGVFKEQYPIITATGEEKWVFEQGRGIYDDNGEVVALEGLIIDVNEQKQRVDEIEFLNYHDILTGLYNRRFFEEEKHRINIESNLPLSVIIGDINGLKLLNDALGHAQGDNTIVTVSKILKNCCRDKDIVARTGGGDFSIFLPNTSYEETCEIMKNIENKCKSNSENAYNTSISMGCATKTCISESLSGIIKLAEDNMYQHKLLQNESLHSSVMSSMKTALFEKNKETEEHAQRLIALSKAIGKKMRLSDGQLNELELLSTLHDIGKIGISDNILNKPGKLTEEEWVQMKKHPEIGYRIAKTSPELAPIANYILCHHERFDGNGYPGGISGKEIPLLSRIISLVDAYDAMTEDRTYRKAMSEDEAICEINNNTGTQFDPDIVKIFLDEVK